MIQIRNLPFLVLLLALISNVGLAQPDVAGKWEVRLQIAPEYGGQVVDSVWELEQSGRKVSGSITEITSGKESEFADGGLSKREGVLSFEIDYQFNGKAATIEVWGVEFKNNGFVGIYEISAFDVESNTGYLVVAGKLVGRKVAASKNSKSKKGTGKEKNQKSKDAKSKDSKQGSGETEVLFDGTSLDNFRGYKKEKIGKGWKVDNGTLHFDGKRSGDIITKKQYGSFELTFDWKVSEGGNSGVMYRVTLGDSAASRSGIEYQILDNDMHKDGKNRKTCAGSLYALYQPGDAAPKAPGEWNSSKIVVDGDKVQHWLNGEKVVDAEIDSEDWKKRISESKFADWKKFGKSRRGHISFQDHKDPVWFRNIKIKAMD